VIFLYVGGPRVFLQLKKRKTTKNTRPKLKKAFDWIEENLENSRAFFHDDLYGEPTVEETELQEILCGKPKNPKKGRMQLLQLRSFVMLAVAVKEGKEEGLLVPDGVGPDGHTRYRYVGDKPENTGDHSKKYDGMP
jgi:hypothetical protein